MRARLKYPSTWPYIYWLCGIETTEFVIFSCGVATISRLPKNVGLFCKRAPRKRLYSAKETYICKEPTSHSHPMSESRMIFRKTALYVEIFRKTANITNSSSGLRRQRLWCFGCDTLKHRTLCWDVWDLDDVVCEVWMIEFVGPIW